MTLNIKEVSINGARLKGIKLKLKSWEMFVMVLIPIFLLQYKDLTELINLLWAIYLAK